MRGKDGLLMGILYSFARGGGVPCGADARRPCRYGDVHADVPEVGSGNCCATGLDAEVFVRRKQFSAAEMSKSLRDLGLTPSAVSESVYPFALS